MADFDKTYDEWIHPTEGFYANLKDDKGGITYAGIASNIFPNWEGFAILRRALEGKPEPKNNTQFPELDPKARAFFRDLYTKNNFDKIASQPVASILFDWFVNTIKAYAETGMSTPIKRVQRYFNLHVDGMMGNLTVAAINKVPEKVIFNEIRKQRIAFYEAIIAKDPSQEKFRETWMARIERFKPM